MLAFPWKTRDLVSCEAAETWAAGKCNHWQWLPVELGLRRGTRSQWRAGGKKVIMTLSCVCHNIWRKSGSWWVWDHVKCRSCSCLGLSEELLQLVLWQQAVVLHVGRDLRRSLGLIVHRAVDLHVPVEDLQEALFALLEDEVTKTDQRWGKKVGWFTTRKIQSTMSWLSLVFYLFVRFLIPQNPGGDKKTHLSCFHPETHSYI